MALISCPECLREVSSYAFACPHCGYPLNQQQSSVRTPPVEAEERIKQALLDGGKISAIKLCRELHPDEGLAEAKSHVEQVIRTLPLPVQQRLGGTGCLVGLMVGSGLMAVGWLHRFL